MIVEGPGVEYQEAEARLVQSLTTFAEKMTTSIKLKKAAQYLQFKISSPKSSLA
jgi:hypothetical protein